MADVASLDPNYNTAIQGFEGFTPTAAWDVNRHRNGYGTNALYPGETIDKSEADRRYSSEMGNASALVDGQFPNLPAGHRAALSSLTFNAGPSWMGSGLGDAVRSGDTDAIKSKFLQYNKSEGKVNDGLTKRRTAEAKWFDDSSGTPMGQAMTPDNAQPTAGQATPAMLAAMTGGQGALSNGGTALDRFNAPDTLGNVGAWLMAAGGDKSAPGMLTALNSKQKDQQFSIVKDDLGNQMVFNHRTGQFVKQQNAGGKSGDDALASSPLGQQEAAKAILSQTSEREKALSDNAKTALELKQQAQQAKELSMDPEVYQGPLAAQWAAGQAGLQGLGITAGKSAAKTALLDKINQNIARLNSQAQGNVTRWAGPEIAQAQRASADITKPREANQQIYDNAIHDAELHQKAFEMGSQYKKEHGHLGSGFMDQMNQHYKENPTQLNPALQSGAAPAQPNRKPLSQIFN